ncbi:MAG: DUF1045 domain-containing protein [Amaricoccus sp.]
MGEWRRHAIYFAPPENGPLARFGAAWLGWDPVAGVPRGRGRVFAGLPCPRAELVAGPDRYGFHATLKAPFRLAAGCDEAGLREALAALAARHRPFEIELGPGVMPGTQGKPGFVALMPTDEAPDLDPLAAACVTELDGFRAPLMPEEIARRGSSLGRAERAHLARWGYPWVLDRFRFHMTLTRPVTGEEAAAVLQALIDPLTPFLSKLVPITEICHFAEGEDGWFRVLGRYPLSG